MGKKNKYKNQSEAAPESGQPGQTAPAAAAQQTEMRQAPQQQPQTVPRAPQDGSGDGPQRREQPHGQQSRPQQPQQGGRSQPQQRRGPQQQQPQGQQARPQQPQQGGGSQQQQQWRDPQQSGQRSQGQQARSQQPQQGGGSQQQQQWRDPQQQQRGQRSQGQQARPQQSQQGGGPQQQQQWGAPQQQQQWGAPQQQRGTQPQGQQQTTGAIPKSASQQQQQQQPQSRQPTRTPSQSSTASSISATSSSGIARGTLGRPDIVETNYLRLNLDKMPAVAYHYDLTITPDRPKKYMRPAFEQFNAAFFKNIAMAFDGKKNVYTIQKLPETPFEGKVQLGDGGLRKKEFTLAIKETDTVEIDLSSLKSYFKERIFDKPMRALQCLEVVLANPCHSRGVRVGRSFFIKPNDKYDLSDGYEMWLGLYQAAILGDQPFLNVDISHKSFPSANSVLNYMQNNIRNVNFNQPLDRYPLNDLRTFLKGISIVYEPPKSFGSFAKTYKVNEISDKSADAISFTTDDGKKFTVAQYFSSKGYNLKYPKLNCLQVGSSVKNNYVPIELCSIPAGQALNKKDGSKQVQNMIRFAATSTNVRKDKIMQMLKYFEHNVDGLIQKFGIRLDPKFIDVPIRLLSSPIMEYYNRATVMPQNGSWRLSESIKFLNTAQPKTGPHKWALIYSKKGRLNYNEAQNLAKMFVTKARSMNMSLADKPDIQQFDYIDTALRQYKNDKYDLVIVVLPNFGTTYADIKQTAELKYGILTQCIKEMTIQRRLDHQLILNLLLKVNAKLNGTNHKVSELVQLKNVMYLGADVTHPSPDQREIPSIVGVAGSHDANGACYNMQYRLQTSTKEEIEDMNSIVTHHLSVYFQYQGSYPQHIIYYRDGVSDGQFPLIRKIELSAIRAACQKLRIAPKLTCVIVVKRHHTRFFPKTVGRDKFNNVTPGSVVDQVIVHPNEVQFFMVSHQSIQGTAKPTRYNVIENDAKLDINLLQTLTYNLCHLFPRCNRVVSYPAPAYLAHLVAFRGRVYVEGTHHFAELKKEYEKRLVRPEFMKSNPMYFV